MRRTKHRGASIYFLVVKPHYFLALDKLLPWHNSFSPIRLWYHLHAKPCHGSATRELSARVSKTNSMLAFYTVCALFWGGFRHWQMPFVAFRCHLLHRMTLTRGQWCSQVFDVNRWCRIVLAAVASLPHFTLLRTWKTLHSSSGAGEMEALGPFGKPLRNV